MPDDDAQAFTRIIRARGEDAEGDQEITLECGHSIVFVVPLREDVTEMFCAQCLNAYLAEQRAKART